MSVVSVFLSSLRLKQGFHSCRILALLCSQILNTSIGTLTSYLGKKKLIFCFRIHTFLNSFYILKALIQFWTKSLLKSNSECLNWILLGRITLLWLNCQITSRHFPFYNHQLSVNRLLSIKKEVFIAIKMQAGL